jgi:phosphatidylserine/phosphatidylglycerophosphate/cardiolipin synthase-like enzyme
MPNSGGKSWLLDFTDRTAGSSKGDGRPWGDGTEIAKRAGTADPWDAGCKAVPLIGGFAAMTALRDALCQAIANAKKAGKPGDELGHVYLAGWRLNPLRDLSTKPDWNLATWKAAAARDGGTPSDETVAGLVLKLMQVGILVRIMVWQPTRWERFWGDFKQHYVDHFWLAEMVGKESARLRAGVTALADKPPVGLVALDARVGPGDQAGAHHQKFAVIRAPNVDVAFVGGVDLGFTRRDTPRPVSGFKPTDPPTFYGGDWESGDDIPDLKYSWPHDNETVYSSPTGIKSPADHQRSDLFVDVYGHHFQRWHDQHVRLEGPVVRSVEEHFRERWQRTGPVRLAATARTNWGWGDVLLSELSGTPKDQMPDIPVGPPINAAVGTSTVQLWRTVPLPKEPAAGVLSRGEFTVLAGMANALQQADELIWVFDQYFWGEAYARLVNRQLKDKNKTGLCMILILPPYADDPKTAARQHGLRKNALQILCQGVPNRTTRVGIYNLWDKGLSEEPNKDGRKQGIYCHAKVHMFDAGLLTIGSANVNRRSYLGDSELVAAISDPEVVKQHQRDLWQLLFGNTNIAWPGADLSTHGAGQAFLAAFDAAAKKDKSFLCPDPWEDANPKVGGIDRKADPPGRFIHDRMDYRCVRSAVERGNADLDTLYRRLETEPGTARNPWPYRRPDW